MIKVHAKSLEMKHTCIICGLTMIIEHGKMLKMKHWIFLIMYNYGKRAKDYELIFLWGNCMIKTYLTDRCVAGYPCTAEWGVRPLHSIHCSSNYSHPAGGTPCLCPPVSVLSVSLYIQWPPGLSIFFNSNSCFVLRLIWGGVPSRFLLLLKFFFLKLVRTNFI